LSGQEILLKREKKHPGTGLSYTSVENIQCELRQLTKFGISPTFSSASTSNVTRITENILEFTVYVQLNSSKITSPLFPKAGNPQQMAPFEIYTGFPYK